MNVTTNRCVVPKNVGVCVVRSSPTQSQFSIQLDIEAMLADQKQCCHLLVGGGNCDNNCRKLLFDMLNGLFPVPNLHPLLRTAASGNPSYVLQLAKMLVGHLPCQVALAAWVALFAGFTAWYLL